MQSIDKSKLPPPPKRDVDPLSTVITVGKYAGFLVLPLLLAFGAKALVWMGIACVGFAIVRLINSPAHDPQPAVSSQAPVAAAVRDLKQDSNDSPTAVQ